MSKVTSSPLPVGTVVGGYQVVRRVAAGAFGMVYLALDPQGQRVALKEYLPTYLVARPPGTLLPQVRQGKLAMYRLGLNGFFEEGRSLAQISHPSVVSVLNFFRENETVYMVMDYLEGASLQDFIVTARDLKQSKVLRESTIRSLFDEVLRGLQIVHQHKMLHLDIKPANIFITDDNRAVLIDFGAARDAMGKQGQPACPMYTPGFAAPEMERRGAALGPWTDIYAIGACMAACMLGCAPSHAPQYPQAERVAMAMECLRGVYSDNLIEVVVWCMASDPLARPQSVHALQKELNREGDLRFTQPNAGACLPVAQCAEARCNDGLSDCGSQCSMPLRFSVFQFSHQGGREKNEDRVGYCHTRGSSLFLLADGMGGHPHGEVAAQLALQTLATLFKEQAKPDLKDVRGFFNTAILAAHLQLLRFAVERGLRDTPRTTLVAAVVQGGVAHWMHCGDSRLYFVRGGELLARTRDHSYLEQQRNTRYSAGLPPGFSRSLLHTCLGSPTKPVWDFAGPVPMQPGDQLLLCSDGLWDGLDDADIVRHLGQQPISVAALSMAGHALAQGEAESDNVTLVTMEWDPPGRAESNQDCICTQGMDNTVFVSTVQTDFPARAIDEPDDEAIGRSIAEFNTTIRRLSARRP